jgi:hypothetical protein
LPPGFTRFATPEEETMITGGTTDTPDEATVPPAAAPTSPPPPAGRPRSTQTGNRWEELNRFVDETLRGELTGSALKVWLVLFRDARDGVARTSQSWIAERAGLTVRGVQMAINKLYEEKLVWLIMRGSPTGGVSLYGVAAVPNPGSGVVLNSEVETP